MQLITKNYRIKIDKNKYTENPGGEDIYAVFNSKDNLWYYRGGYHYVGTDEPWTIVMGEQCWDELILKLKWGK